MGGAGAVGVVGVIVWGPQLQPDAATNSAHAPSTGESDIVLLILIGEDSQDNSMVAGTVALGVWRLDGGCASVGNGDTFGVGCSQ